MWKEQRKNTQGTWVIYYSLAQTKLRDEKTEIQGEISLENEEFVSFIAVDMKSTYIFYRTVEDAALMNLRGRWPSPVPGQRCGEYKRVKLKIKDWDRFVKYVFALFCIACIAC